MAEVRASYPGLEDPSTGAGVPAAAVQEGDAVGAKKSLIAFAAKSASGNVALIPLTAEGKVPVDTEADAGTVLSDTSGTPTDDVVTGSTGAFVEVAKITLAVSKVHRGIKALGSCFRDTVFRVRHNNNGADVIVGTFLVGSGNFNGVWDGLKKSVTSGATGTQELVLEAKNLQQVSDLRGYLEALEVAPG